MVFAVDEKPSVQALERAHGYLKLPNGRELTGQSHDYKRNGTTTPFAALFPAARSLDTITNVGGASNSSTSGVANHPGREIQSCSTIFRPKGPNATCG
jgi:hypothetical protein